VTESFQVTGTRTPWFAWFAGFVLLAAGWALVTPINGYPDEVDHVYRAASVVRGEIFPHIGAYTHGTGAITDVPVTLRNVALRVPCRGRFTQDSLCRPARPDEPKLVTVETSEGRRFPLYYALVGWPSLAFPNETGWLLMRLVSAVLCSVFLASGAFVLMSMRRRPLVLAAGLFVGLTPLAVDLAGALNPSGLEVASALCMWVVVLALAHGTSSLSPRRLVGLGVFSSVALVTSREPGFAWIALAVVLAYISANSTQRAQFVRARSTRVVLGCAAAATLVMAVWSVAFRSYETFFTPPASGTGLAKAVSASYGHVETLLRQTLAFLGYLSLPPPVLSEVCWILAVAALVVFAVGAGRRTGIATLLGCVLVVLIPFVVEVATYTDRGLSGWQGRYTLPFAVGVPLLAVVPARPMRTEWRFVALVVVPIVALTVVGQVVVFKDAWGSLVRPDWYVPFGDVLAAAGAVIVLATVGWAEMRWRRATRDATSSDAVVGYDPSRRDDTPADRYASDTTTAPPSTAKT
jgi:hypothetical protein